MMSNNINNSGTLLLIVNSIKERSALCDGPVNIAVGGPGGSGKSTFCQLLSDMLSPSAIFRLDDYKTCRKARRKAGLYGPHPAANEMELVLIHLEEIRSGRKFFRPVYDRKEGRIDSTEIYEPARYNIIDGEISTYRQFSHLVDYSIYLDTGIFTQLKTRLVRDVRERGYSRRKALATFFGSNISEFKSFGEESRKWADAVLFRSGDRTLRLVKC